MQKGVKSTRRKLKKAVLNFFTERSVDAVAVTVEEITEKADLGKGML